MALLHFVCHASIVDVLSCFLITFKETVVAGSVFLDLMASRSLIRSLPGGILASIKAAVSDTVLYALIILSAAIR